LTQAIFIKDFL